MIGTPLEDLVYRMGSAEITLSKLATSVRGKERARLLAKAEGVSLARSYVEEHLAALTDDPGYRIPPGEYVEESVDYKYPSLGES